MVKITPFWRENSNKLFPYSLADIWAAACWWLKSTTNVRKAKKRSAFIMSDLARLRMWVQPSMNLYTEE